MNPVRLIESRTLVLPADDIDTDQIIPARFLVATERGSWGAHLFADRRYDPAGRPRPDFPLNDPRAAGAEVLVAGRNFGCGSSREHAAWALGDFGFRAVIASSFADIFRTNALKNGIVPVVAPPAVHTRLLRDNGVSVTIDVAEREVRLADGTAVAFPLDDFSRYCLLGGIDELDYLIQAEGEIAAFEGRAR